MANKRKLGHWILKGKKPVEVGLMEWAEWLENPKNHRTLGHHWIGETRVSTVFIGLDHNPLATKPEIFETMTFNVGEQDQQWRFATYDEALTNHWKQVGRAMIRHLTGEWPPE